VEHKWKTRNFLKNPRRGGRGYGPPQKTSENEIKKIKREKRRGEESGGEQRGKKGNEEKEGGRNEGGPK